MQVEKYLKEHQPIIYQTFLNALQKDQLSHAYLLSGSNGAPLLDVAQFFAKSILCDNPSPMACDNCFTCSKVDDGKYADLFVYDGSKASIKKEDVDTIETSFEMEAFEEKGIRVYILHLIETMTVSATNSILKFLEEPGKQTYAFLTTNNENLVLPTIISRCQLLRLKTADKQLVIKEAMELGVEEKDAELLSCFYNNGELIKEIIDSQEENDAFFTAKECFEQTIEILANEETADVMYYVQSNVVNNVKSKETCRYYINMLVTALEDVINIQNQKNAFLTSYVIILNNLANKLSHIDESLIELLKCGDLINLNVNIPLLIEHIFHTITKED